MSRQVFTGTTLDPATLGEQLWQAIIQIYGDWFNTEAMGDGDGAARAEQEFRFFALTFTSLMADGAAITTGRKAVIRSIYHKLGQRDAANVVAMLDVVIAREEAATRRR